MSAFRCFENNDASRMVDTRKDPFIACNPFVLDGDEWRQQRAIFSPLLTSGRIRTAYSNMQRICGQLCDYIDEQSRSGQPFDGIDVSLHSFTHCEICKYIFGQLGLRFTSENLLDCVLGIEARSFTDSRLPVAQHNKQMSEENYRLALSGALNGLFPRLPRCLRPKIVPPSYERFFGDLVRQSFHLRRCRRQQRNDFINHLLDMQREHQLTEEQLTSHAMTFMFDGLDTTSSTIAHCLLLVRQFTNSSYFRLIYEFSVYSSAGIRSASSNCGWSWTRPAPKTTYCPPLSCSASCPI